jgi:hypothetical protein
MDIVYADFQQIFHPTFPIILTYQKAANGLDNWLLDYKSRIFLAIFLRPMRWTLVDIDNFTGIFRVELTAILKQISDKQFQ